MASCGHLMNFQLKCTVWHAFSNVSLNLMLYLFMKRLTTCALILSQWSRYMSLHLEHKAGNCSYSYKRDLTHKFFLPPGEQQLTVFHVYFVEEKKNNDTAMNII